MNNDKEILSIKLLDQTLQIKTDKDKAETLQTAAQLLNEELREIRNNKLATGTERIALMSGLNLAYKMLLAQAEKNSQLDSIETMNAKIKALQNRIEKVVV